MKKLCVVNYIYGAKYQSFIPLYIISLKESYPEYDVRLYIDKELNADIKGQVNILRKYYDGIIIIENYGLKTKFSQKALLFPQIQRSQRWLFFDEEFLNYEAIYIGDIDLLIFKEDKPLFEQHIEHCNYINRSYSNIARLGPVKSKNLKTICRNIIKYGLIQTLKYYFSKQERVIKFSGLHFIKSKDYFSKVNIVINEFYDELNLLAKGNSKIYNLPSFNNEALLRDVILKAGLGDCELSTGKPYNIEKDPQTIAFRPHHGIHLGIFRAPQSLEVERDLISSNVYRDYYGQFMLLKEKDSYKEIEDKFSEYLVDIINRMEDYYSKL